MFLSIKSKIVFIVSVLLLLSIGGYLYMTSQTFREDKVGMVYDLNKNSVHAVSGQVQVAIQNTHEKLKLMTSLSLNSKVDFNLLRNILETDSSLVHVEIYEKKEKDKLLLLSLSHQKFKELNNLAESFFTKKIIQERQVPFPQMQTDQLYLWNASTQKGPPLVGVGFSVDAEVNKKTKTKFIVFGYIKIDDVLKTLSQSSASQISILNSYGHILVHTNLNLIKNLYSLKEHPLFSDASSSTQSLVVKKYDYQNVQMLGAYSKSPRFGISVISETPSDQALEAVTLIFKRTTLLGSIIVTLVFMVMTLFMETITKPLSELMSAMQKMGAGEIPEKVRVKSKDEVGVLSTAFNQMTDTLVKSRRALEELNESLEAKVKERTFQLEELATKDPLTGLYNRRYFTDRLKDEISRSKRTQKPTSLVYMDIDHFKKFNDANGHPEGDKLLKQFSEVVKTSIRSTDVLARVGGEEFCVILPDTSLEGALMSAEKIRVAIESTPFEHGHKQPLGKVTCSLGVSAFPTIAQNQEDLIRTADEALYEIKKSSRNCVGAAKTAASPQEDKVAS